MTAVYRLLPMLDVPEFATLRLVDNRPVAHGATLLSDFSPRDVPARDWQAPRVAAVWQPREVIDPLPGLRNDYPAIQLVVPAFSGRAVAALRDLLEPDGELLPLRCATGEYWAFNPTTVRDALDHAASIIKWPVVYKVRKQVPVLAETIGRYAFAADRLGTASVFRIPEAKMDFFVTERFAGRVRDAELRGFNLVQVWCSPGPVGGTAVAGRGPPL